MTTPEQFARELRTFSDRKVISKQLRKDIRKPVPMVRKTIKKRATDTLPASGGLNKWVASTRITALVKVTSRTIRVKLKGGRNSKGSRSDVNAIDRGRLRAPSWGHAPWHSQSVTPGFFSDPFDESVPEWVAVIEAAIDAATAEIRR